MGCPQFAERVDRGEASLPRRFRILDVAHGHFHRDIRSLAEGGDFDYRDTSLTRSRESKRRVRRDCRWNEDGSTPSSGFEKSVQPSHGDWLWIEGHEPSKCTDLRPNVPDFPSRDFGGQQILLPMGRNSAQ